MAFNGEETKKGIENQDARLLWTVMGSPLVTADGLETKI
jgi:hypothetical protein